MSNDTKIRRFRLGKALAVYRAAGFSRSFIWFRFFPVLTLTLIFLGVGYWQTSANVTAYGPAAAGWTRAWYILAALVTIPLLVWLITQLRRRTRVSLHENGLLFAQRRINYRIPWGHITGIYDDHTRYHLFGRTLSTRRRVRLETTTTPTLVLRDDIAKMENLVEQVKKRVQPLLYTSIHHALTNEKAVYFGPLTLTKKQIVINEHSIPWDDVGKISVDRGQLRIERNSGPALRRLIRVPTATIPNLELLLKLIDEDIRS